MDLALKETCMLLQPGSNCVTLAIILISYVRDQWFKGVQNMRKN